MKVRKITNSVRRSVIATAIPAGLVSMQILAADDAELAKKTQNPIADLVNVPLQLNHDKDIGQISFEISTTQLV